MVWSDSISRMPPRKSKLKSKASTKKAKTTREPNEVMRSSEVESGESLSAPLDTITSARVTEKHIFFWGGILSNWWLYSPNFSGGRCFELILPQLDALHIAHPLVEALTTRLMRDHMFNCGEQWMMAMKGWLFEPSIELGKHEADSDISEERTVLQVDRLSYESLRKDLLAPKMRSDWKHWVPGVGDQLTKEGELYESTVCKVLRSSEPGDQKCHGRHARNFDPEAWKEPSIISTVAACVARAEVDINLRKIYLASDKKFVEGSPKDHIWGAGLHWKGPHIDNENNWKGENRLGKCHDEAANRTKQMLKEIQSDDVSLSNRGRLMT